MHVFDNQNRGALEQCGYPSPHISLFFSSALIILCECYSLNEWCLPHPCDLTHFTCRSTYLYDTLRPKLVHETNIDFLCELVDILKMEVLGEQHNRRSESLAGLRPTFQRILADVHERLTFRARTHIRDEVGFLSFFFLSQLFYFLLSWLKIYLFVGFLF